MSGFATALMARVNPVLEREVQERMRSRRAPLMLFFFVGILSAIAYLVYVLLFARRSGTVDPTQLSRLGKDMFETLLLIMLLLVLFLVPGLASGAIAGERERQTLVPMQVTLLKPRRIILGKIAASCAYLTFLLIAAAPLLTLSFVIGGVSVGQIVWGLASVIFVGFVIAAISVMCSTITNRVQVANVLSFFLVLVLLVGVPIGYSIASAFMSTRENGFQQAPVALLAANPVTLVAAVAGGESSRNRFGSSSSGPLSTTKRGLVETARNDAMAFQAIEPIEQERPTVTGFVVLSVLVQGGLALLAIVVGSRRLRTPAKTER